MRDAETKEWADQTFKVVELCYKKEYNEAEREIIGLKTGVPGVIESIFLLIDFGDSLFETFRKVAFITASEHLEPRLIVEAQKIIDREKWLHDNPELIKSVKRGLEQDPKHDLGSYGK